jgi:hypothetical protein
MEQDQQSGAPALLQSSSYLFVQNPDIIEQRTPIELSAFDHGMVVRPFTKFDPDRTCGRPPIMCLHCGAYFNVYALIDATTGDWKCNLCQKLNSSFYPVDDSIENASHLANLRDIYTEMQESHVDFVESSTGQRSRSNHSNAVVQPMYYFVIDYTLLSQPTISHMLETAFKTLPSDALVAVAVYSKCINLFRLSSLSKGMPLCSDALPGATDQSQYLYHLLATGVHTLDADELLENFFVFISALQSFNPASTGSNRMPSPLKGIRAKRGSKDHTSSTKSLATGGKRPSHPIVYNRSSRTQLKNMTSAEPGSAGVGVKEMAQSCSVSALVALGAALGEAHGRSVQTILLTERAYGLSLDHLRSSGVAGHSMTSNHLSDINGSDGQPSLHTNAYARALAQYLDIGRMASVRGCWIDGLHFGPEARLFDLLDSLCGASGGMFFHAPDFTDTYMQPATCTLTKMIKKSIHRKKSSSGVDATYGIHENTHFPCRGTLASVEVRSSPNISVERIVGPVFDLSEARSSVKRFRKSYDISSAGAGAGAGAAGGDDKAKRGWGDCSSWAADHSRFDMVDPSHLESTLQAIDIATRAGYSDRNDDFDSNGNTRASGLSISTQKDALYEHLSEYNEDATVACALARCDGETEVTLAIKHRPVLPTSMNLDGVIDFLLPSQADEDDGDDILKHEPFGYIQIVIRHISPSGDIKITRVKNARIALTADVDEFLWGLNEHVYGVCLSRGLVADYHDAVITAYGGASRPLLKGPKAHEHLRAVAQQFPGVMYMSSSTSSSNRHSIEKADRDPVRTHYVSAVDCMLRSLVSFWRRDSGRFSHKLRIVSRMLYVLREGPLLDGPAMQSPESYILRSEFLMACVQKCSRLLNPTVRLLLSAHVFNRNAELLHQYMQLSDTSKLTQQKPKHDMGLENKPFDSGKKSDAPAQEGTVGGTGREGDSNAIRHGNEWKQSSSSSSSSTTRVAAAAAAATIEGSSDDVVELMPHVLMEAPAESLALLPQCSALIDFGDMLIIRCGSQVSNRFSS